MDEPGEPREGSHYLPSARTAALYWHSQKVMISFDGLNPSSQVPCSAGEGAVKWQSKGQLGCLLPAQKERGRLLSDGHQYYHKGKGAGYCQMDINVTIKGKGQVTVRWR